MSGHRADIVIVAVGLLAAVLSMLFLTLPWDHAVIAGRQFPVLAGYISTLSLVSSIPFAWPFFVVGLCLRWRRPARSAAWYLFSLVLAGAVLQSLLTSAEHAADAPLSSYISFYSGFLGAPLFAFAGFLVAQFTRFDDARTA